MAERTGGRNGLLGRWFGASRRPMLARRRPPPRLPDLLALEDRTLLSATPVDEELATQLAASALGTPPAAERPSGPAPATPTDTSTALAGGQTTTPRATNALIRSTETSPLRREVVFVDASVDNAARLAEQIRQSAAPDRQLDVIVLRGGEDGVQQISDVLAGYVSLDAVHVLSHGRDGAVKLGDVWLTSDNVAGYGQELSEWGRALAPEADLLLYGCDLAGTQAGRGLVTQLHGLTGADVAASTDATGTARAGGNWDLEYRAGLVETQVVPADVPGGWDGLLAASSTGTALWRQAGTAAPLTSQWDGLTFGGASGSVGVGQWRIVQGAEAPTRDEIIAVGVDSFGRVTGERWDGTSWSALPFNSLATGRDPTLRGFDVAYESQSGEALLVWNNGSAGKDGISYRVWNGATWSAEQVVNAPNPGEPLHMQLAASPTRDEMVLVVSSSTGHTYALVWDGSAWTSPVSLMNASGPYGTISVAYEGQSGQALVTYNNHASDLKYRTWDGASWSSTGSAGAPPGVTGVTRWATLSSDAGSDRLALAAVTGDGEAYFAVWDGSAWGNRLLATTAAANTTTFNAAAAFEARSGELLATYAVGGTTDVRYRTWAAGVWSAEQLGPNLGGQLNTLTLSSSPAGNDLMLAAQDDLSDLHFVRWNGSAWGADNELETNTAEVGNQPFLFLWDQGTQVDTTGPALWLSTEKDVAAPGVPGVNSFAKAEALRFSGPGLTLEPGTTGGAFSHLLGEAWAADGDANIDALHFVSRGLTVGGGANTFTLLPGDVLFSMLEDETLVSSNTLAVLDGEVIVFRPDTPGDYGTGTFTTLLHSFGSNHGGTDTWSLALVEVDTVFGDVTLTAGTFLFSRDGGAEDNDIYRFIPTGVGVGTTTGTVELLIEGNDVGVGAKVFGLDLVSRPLTIGGATLAQGTLLVTLDADDVVGANDLATRRGDVFTLTVTQTTLGSGTAAATASLLFEGADVGLAGPEEALDALAIFPGGNQAPDVRIPPGPLAYAENAAPVVLAPAASVSDGDSPDFDAGSLVVRITTSATADDRLGIRDVGTGPGQIGVSGANVTYGGVVIGSFAGGTDGFTPLVVNLNASATPAAAQALLRSITFHTVTDAPSAVQRTVQFTVNDGDGGSAGPLPVAVDVAAVNDPPAVSASGGSAAYTEDAAPSLLDAGLVVGDVDDATLAGATVRISGNYAAAEDGLVFTDQNGISGSWSAATGTLELTGLATVADYQAALRSVAYLNASQRPSTLVRTLTFTVTDAAGASGSGTRDLYVTAVNDAPTVAGPGAQSTAEDTPLVFSSAAGNAIVVGDVDAASAQVEVTLSAGAGTGTLTLAALVGLTFSAGDGVADPVMTFRGTLADVNAALDGLVFTPAADFNGPTSVAATVDDLGNSGAGGPAGASYTIPITVTSVNDPPLIVANQLVIAEGGTVILATSDVNSADVDDGPAQLTYTVTGLSGGQFELAGSPGVAVLSFTQAQVDAGQVRFVHDGGEAAPAYSLTVSDGTANDGPRAATVFFTNVNDGPVLAVNQLTITEGQAVVLSGSELRTSDPDNAPAQLVYTVSAVSGGRFEVVSAPGVAVATFTQAQVDAGQVRFVHDGGESAPGYQVTVSDGSLSDGPHDAAVTFTNVNDAPVITANSLTVSEGATVVLTSADVFAADPDNAPAELAYAVSGVSGGHFELLGGPGVAVAGFTQAEVNAGQVLFVHDGGEAAPAYSLSVSDGALADGPAAAAVTFTNVNDAPVLIANTLTLAEGQAVVLGAAELSSADPDNAPGQLTYAIANLSGGRFELTTAPGVAVFTFTQADVDAGVVRFVHDGGEAAPSYDVTLSDGSLADGPQVANVSFSNVNDPPTLSLPPAQAMAEDTPLVFSAANGNAISVADPDAAAGLLQVTLTVTNGTLTLGGAAAVNVLLDTGGQIVFEGTLANLNAALDGMTFTPAANYQGAAELSVRVDDRGNSGAGGALTAFEVVAIDVGAVNDAPSIIAPVNVSTQEDTQLVWSAAGGNAVTVGDVDADPAPVRLSLTVARGRLSLATTTGLAFSTGDGTADTTLDFTGTVAAVNAALDGLRYDPDADFNGGDALTVVIDDQGRHGAGGPLRTTRVIRITVTPVNDAPVAAADEFVTDEDTPLSVARAGVLANDTDVDGPALRAVLVVGPSHGSLTLNADGSFAYHPDANYFGTDRFVYAASDGGLTSSGEVLVTVREINDAPRLVGRLPGGVVERLVPGAVLGSVTAADVDGDALAFALVDDGGGRFAIDPATGAIRVVSTGPPGVQPSERYALLVRVSDGRGATTDFVQTIRLARQDAPLVTPPPLPAPNPVAPAPDAPAADTEARDELRVQVVTRVDGDRAGGQHHASVAGTVGGSAETNLARATQTVAVAVPQQAGFGDAGVALTFTSAADHAIPTHELDEARADGLGASGAPARRGGSRVAIPPQLLDRLEGDLEELARSVRGDDWSRSAYVTLATGLSAGYVALSLRHLYLLTGVLLSRPLWNSFDPLNVLDAWSTEEGRLLLGAADNEEEDELDPVLGAGAAGRGGKETA